MDPLASLPSRTSQVVTENVGEGRVVTVDAKSQSATVQLQSGNLVNVTLPSSVKEGERVWVVRQRDGELTLRDPRERTLLPLLEFPETLDAWLGDSEQSEPLRKAVRQGDLLGARLALQSVWNEKQNASIPENTADKRVISPPFLARNGETGSGAVAVRLLGEPKAGVYTAELAGKKATLYGPEGIGLGLKGVLEKFALSKGIDVWLPFRREMPAVTELPARIATDTSGAKQLLEWVGEANPDAQALDEVLQVLSRATLEYAASQAGNGGAVKPPDNLPSVIAMRALAAWAVFGEQEIPDAVWKALVAPTQDLGVLWGQLLSDSSFGELRQEWERLPATQQGAKVLLPTDLGLDGTQVGEHLEGESSLVKTLFHEMITGQQTRAPLAQEVVRQSLETLLQQGLQQFKSPGESVLPWVHVPTGQQPTSGGVVIRDERSSKSHTSDDKDQPLTMDVSMDPSGLGNIHARLTLEGQILSVTLTPRLPATFALLASKMDDLRQVLQSTGLQIRDVQVARGKIADPEESRVRTGKKKGVFDVRA